MTRIAVTPACEPGSMVLREGWIPGQARDDSSLRREGKFLPKKSFGQNFLQDQNILEAIAFQITSLKPDSDTKIYEIGAGLGALTQALLKTDSFVEAIERDRDLIPILNSKFSTPIACGKLVLHEANAVTFFRDKSFPQPFVLCGNLPYHLTSSILFEIAEFYQQLYGAVFLIQKEVAERILAEPNSKTYGLLSVILQSRFSTEIAFDVPRQAFWPAPKVESSVLKLTSKKRSPLVSWPLFVEVVKKAFLKRRKILTNSLENYSNIEEILHRLQINPKSRAENLSFEDYEAITSCLQQSF